MGERNLTPKQRELLSLVGRQRTIRSGLKGQLVGDGWRVLDRLVGLGLVEHIGFGAHRITDAGRKTLSDDTLPATDEQP